MIICELKAIHDSRKSFYRKAFVVFLDLDILLVSYDTVICTIKENGTLVMECDLNDMSVTTKRHFREFRKQLSYRIEE